MQILQFYSMQPILCGGLLVLGGGDGRGGSWPVWDAKEASQGPRLEELTTSCR